MTPEPALANNAAVATVDLTDGAKGSDGDDALPATYQAALRLDEAGLSAREIAEQLDVEEASVPLLLDLARRKRDRRVTAKHAKG